LQIWTSVKLQPSRWVTEILDAIRIDMPTNKNWNKKSPRLQQMLEMLWVVMHTFLAPPQKVYIHTLNSFFSNVANLKFPSPVFCTRWVSEFWGKCSSVHRFHSIFLQSALTKRGNIWKINLMSLQYTVRNRTSETYVED
jgi:hypothetical protein